MYKKQGNQGLFDDEWDNWDFLIHYTKGEGEDVRLEDIGKEDEIRNSDSYQTLLTNLSNQIEGKILEAINDQNLSNNSTESISYHTKNSYEFQEDAFAIGGATILTQSEIEFVINNQGIVNWNGAAAVHFKDVFKDPLDLFDWVPGSYDTGIPFNISGDWTEPLDGEFNSGD